jgi:hypothetical protein
MTQSVPASIPVFNGDVVDRYEELRGQVLNPVGRGQRRPGFDAVSSARDESMDGRLVALSYRWADEGADQVQSGGRDCSLGSAR